MPRWVDGLGLCAMVLLAPESSPGLEGEIQARVQANQMTVSQALELDVHVRVPLGHTVQWPASDADLGGFTLVRVIDQPERLLSSGAIEYARTYVLDPFLPGETYLPPLEVACQAPGGQTRLLKTEAISVMVSSILEDEYSEASWLGLAENLSSGSAWWWGGGLIGLGFIVGLRVLWWRRKAEAERLAGGAA